MRDKIVGWMIIAGFLAGLGFVALQSNPPSHWGDQIVHAQGDTLPRADCYAEGRATATGLQIANGGFNNLGTTSDHNVPCTNWHLVYFSNGASAVGIGIQVAADSNGVPGSFSYPQPISGANPAVTVGNGQLSLSTYYPWINVNVSTLTAKGAVTWRLLGWRPGPNSDVNAPSVNGGTATDIQNISVSAAAGVTMFIPGVSGVITRIYGLQAQASANAPGTMQLVEGGGATCATNELPLTILFSFAALPSGANGNLIVPFGSRPLVTEVAGDNVCVVNQTISTDVGAQFSQP